MTSPYDFYLKRNQLLINLERAIESSTTPHMMTPFKDEHEAMMSAVKESYDSLDVCTTTGEKLPLQQG